MTNSKSYITSDLHFFHQRIIKYAERDDYENTEYDTLRMSYNIATYIDHHIPDAPGIVLWNLGDVFYGPMVNDQSLDVLKNIVSIMKGKYRRLKLVLGNHDRQFRDFEWKDRTTNYWIGNLSDIELFRLFGFDDVYDYPVLDGQFIFSHEPVYLPEGTQFLNIHGHTHQTFVDHSYFTWKFENHDLVKKAYEDFEHKNLINIDEKIPDWENYIINPKNYINACWDATKHHHIIEFSEIKDRHYEP